MSEIKYHPLLDADDSGYVKVPMFAVTDINIVKENHELYLEEIVHNHFRLCSVPGDNQNSYLKYTILCPTCGSAMVRISSKINNYRLGLYSCTECEN